MLSETSRRAVILLSSALLVLGSTSITTTARANPAALPIAAPTPHGLFHPIELSRVLDTAAKVGATRLAAGQTIRFAVAGQGSVPATNVAAVAIDLAVRNPTQSGTIAVFPGGTTWNGAATMSVLAGQTAQGDLTANLGSDGTLSVRNNLKAPVDLIGDVTGYFDADLGTTSTPGSYVPLAGLPRVVDTHATPLPAGSRQTFPGLGGQSTSGVSAVVVNLTVLAPAKAGTVAVYSADQGWDGAPTMTVAAGRNQQRMAVLALDSTGSFTVQNNLGGGLSLLIDAVGFYRSGDAIDRGAYRPLPAPVQYDTRAEGQVAIQPGRTAYVFAPRRGTEAAQLDIMVVRPTVRGSISVLPGTSGWTNAATMSFAAGVVTEQPVTADLSVDRGIKIQNNTTAPINVVVEQYADFIGLSSPAVSSSTPLIDPSYGRVTGVSCPTPTFCAALQSNGYVTTYDGSTWSAANRLTGLSVDRAQSPGFNAGAISCTSPQFCVAVGARIAMFDGTTWTTRPEPVARPGLDELSCPSSMFCVAAGQGPQFEMWNGSSWTATSMSDIPWSDYARVSCASSTACIAVSNGRMDIWNGSVWTSGPAPTLTYATSVSCATPTFCVEIDANGQSARWNGGSWTPLTGDVAGKVSCPSASYCLERGATSGTNVLTGDSTAWTAVGSSSPSSTYAALSCAAADVCVEVTSRALTTNAETWNGTNWSDQYTVDPGHGVLTGISCPAVDRCIATDINDSYFVYDGSGWSGASEMPAGLQTMSVSCPSLTLCLAVGYHGQYTTFDGSTWSTPKAVPGAAVLKSVSCDRTISCFALAGDYQLLHWDGSTWSAPMRLPGDASVTSVDCPSANFCFAQTQASEVGFWNGAQWSTPTATGLDAPGLVSCASQTYCLAHTYGPDPVLPLSNTLFSASVWNGATWTLVPTGPGDANGTPVCIVDGACLIVNDAVSDWNGTEWSAPSSPWASLPAAMYQISCVGPTFCAVSNQDAQAAILHIGQ